MTMSNDDIIMPNRFRAGRPSQGPFEEPFEGPSQGPFRERTPGRGPVIDQDGNEIPDPGMRAQFEAWRLRDALSLADWLRYQSGYTAGIAERALHGKAGG